MINDKNFQFKSFAEMIRKFPDDNSCREYLEYIRWNNYPICPYCGVDVPYVLTRKGVFEGNYKCCCCKQRFNVATNTLFEGSHIGYKDWFIAIYLFQSHKNGISALQISKDLGITHKSAWFMLHRIRHAMQENEEDKMDGTVQLDETFVGGKNKNRHHDKKVEQSQGRSFKDKTPIFGMFQQAQYDVIVRPNKRNPLLNVLEKFYHSTAFVRLKVVNNTKAKSLRPLILKNIEKGSTIVSDEWQAYNGLNWWYNHKVVDHRKKNYVTEDGYSSNGLEGFWTWLKRTFTSTYHIVSRKYMQAYANEIAFRYNFLRLKDPERFVVLLFNSRERLTYKKLKEGF